MEFENHFNCVHRSKIARKIMELQAEYNKMGDEVPPSVDPNTKNWVHLSDKDNLFLMITLLEDLLH